VGAEVDDIMFLFMLIDIEGLVNDFEGVLVGQVFVKLQQTNFCLISVYRIHDLPNDCILVEQLSIVFPVWNGYHERFGVKGSESVPIMTELFERADTVGLKLDDFDLPLPF